MKLSNWTYFQKLCR